MTILSRFVEIAATFTESILILSAITIASGKKFTGWKKNILLIAFSVCSTTLIRFLNALDTFSYITPIISMAFFIFISSKAMSTGTLLTRSITCILSLLLIQCIDYIVVIIFALTTSASNTFFTAFVSSQGVKRVIFLTIDKLIDIVFYFLLRRWLPGLSKLTPRLSCYLLVISIVSYIVMQCLFQVVLVPNLPIMQLAVVASWCFLIGFIIAFIAFFLSLTRHEQDRQRLEMLRSENVLMAENYKSLHAVQQISARTLHDFKHHVMTMRDLISTGKVKSAQEYMDSLLKTSYHQATQCHSGNDIVDAIINSKLAEAQVKNIQFTYMANLHIPVKIDPVDLCGVLANQLENAFEACIQISDPAKRIVHAEIKQVQSFVILRVENTVLSDPFADNPNLYSTKPASSIPHGYGLLNIRSIAQKYEGTLRTEFVNDKFVSVVSLCDLPFDTNNSTVG